MLPLGPVAPPKRGRSGAQADSAALTFGFDELNAPLVPVAPVAPALGPVGKLMPCSFRQLRYAVKAVLLKAPLPPPKKLPLGRRLAQAANAFANFEFTPPAKPLGPVPKRRNGGAPPPLRGEPLPGRKPPRGELSETPCCFKQAVNALVEAFAEEEPVEPVLEVDFDAVAFGVLEPPQAATLSARAPIVNSATTPRSLGGLRSRRAIC